MNKDLHNIDDVFNSAHRDFEDEPSPAVWQKINEELDKKEAESYKRRFIGWKRTAILLLFLLAGFILFDSGILHRNSGIAKKNNPEQKQLPLNESPQKSNTGSGPDAVDSNNNGPLIHQDENDLSKMNPDRLLIEKNNPVIKKYPKSGNPNQNLPVYLTNNKNQESVILPWIHDKTTGLPDEKNYSANNRRVNVLPGEYSFSKTIAQLLNFLTNTQLPVVKNPDMKSSVAENKQQKKRNSFGLSWALSPFYSYDFMNYRLDNDQSAVKKIKQSEAHEPSFSSGLLLTAQFKKGWSLQTGLVYSNTKIGISPQKLYALQDPSGNVDYKYITSSGYAYIKPSFGTPPAVGDSLTTSEAQHTLQFISVPLVIKHSFGKKKLTVNPGAGVEANILTSAKLVTEIEDASNRENVIINKLNGAKSFYWSVTANTDIEYQVNKKIAINLRPSFRYAVTPITKNNVVETYPYSFGLGLGVKFRL